MRLALGSFMLARREALLSTGCSTSDSSSTPEPDLCLRSAYQMGDPSASTSDDDHVHHAGKGGLRRA